MNLQGGTGIATWLMSRAVEILGLARAREQAPEEMDSGDLDQYQAWSISCQLAAVPPGSVEQLPADIAALVRQAKSLHPKMAEGASNRERAGSTT